VHVIQDVEVMLGDGVGFFEPGDVLAQLGENRAARRA